MQADLEAGPLYGESLGKRAGHLSLESLCGIRTQVGRIKGVYRSSVRTGCVSTLKNTFKTIFLFLHWQRWRALACITSPKGFKQSTGTTPHQFVLDRKIERAKELLHDPNRSVPEASARRGFVDQKPLHQDLPTYGGRNTVRIPQPNIYRPFATHLL